MREYRMHYSDGSTVLFSQETTETLRDMAARKIRPSPGAECRDVDIAARYAAILLRERGL